MGSLGNLQVLYLSYNQFGDAGMAAFANAIKSTPENPMGSLGHLTRLDIANNKIADPGMVSFSDAIAKGALPKLKIIVIGGNPGNTMGLKEACSVRGIQCYG